ncbi:hypothetical protein B0H11DRAFT_2260771 [Mycena galericulata]|nr:hypothetical protein B0H11DRAFT_2260771 [Mycena galericulata]
MPARPMPSSTAPLPAVHAALSLLFVALASFLLTLALLPLCGFTLDAERLSLLTVARATGACAGIVFVLMSLIVGLWRRRRGGNADADGKKPDVECTLDVRDREAAVRDPPEKADR